MMTELIVGFALGVLCPVFLWPACQRLRNRSATWMWMINRCPYWWAIWAEPLRHVFRRFAYVWRSRLFCRICDRSVSTVTESWYGVEQRNGALATVGECWRCRKD